MSEEASKAIQAVKTRFVDIVEKKQYDKCADFFTEDGSLTLTGVGTINGRKELHEFSMTKLPSYGALSYEKNEYFELMNDTTAFSIDLFASKDHKGTLTGLFTCCILWKKVDGIWLFDRDFINSPPLPKSALQQELDAREGELFAAWAKEDYEAAAQIYTEDAMCFPDKREPIVGRKAFQKFTAEFIPSLLPLVRREIGRYELLNDSTAQTEGGCYRMDSNGKIIMQFDHCLLWKKIDGQWYIAIDTFMESFRQSDK